MYTVYSVHQSFSCHIVFALFVHCRSSNLLLKNFEFCKLSNFVSLQVKIDSFYKFSQVYRNVLVRMEKNVCDGLKRPIPTDEIFTVTDGNIFKGCPFKNRIYVTDLKFNNISDIEEHIFAGNWRIEFKFFTKINKQIKKMLILEVFASVNYVSDG